MKLISLSNDGHESKTIHAEGSTIFENGKVTTLTSGADEDTDEDSREECTDGPLVIARD